jgi:ADP-ribose pyrophosphatase YjhB (NUDIX family)
VVTSIDYVRSAVIIIENERVTMIERVREGHTYYLFPGGEVEVGETIEEAAIREACEELGLNVQLGPLVAIVEFRNRDQYYYLASAIGGNFGTGDGEELSSSPESLAGSYRPIWLYDLFG